MPVQHSSCGRVLPRFTPRRLTLLLGSIILVAIFMIAAQTNGFPETSTITVYDHKISIPKISDSFRKGNLNSYRQPAHAPPRQKGDENIGSAWWADWKWLSTPFSKTVTQDDDRALLPFLTPRQPIYCYYDATEKKTTEEKDVESERLLIWRRAWWARGFRPMILSASEAMNNPLYQELQQTKNLDPTLQSELMRWLAWDSMEGGLLSQSLLLPMGVEYHVLPHLRRGQFTNLTRWENLADGLFAGNRESIQAAIRTVFGSDKRSKTSSILEVIPHESIVLDKGASALAYYSTEVIQKKYPKLYSESDTPVDKEKHLNQLVTSHLQNAWQNSFHDGIEVLKPFPQHSTAMVANALALAKSLIACPVSPLPASCPPNMHNCISCGTSAPMKIITPQQFHNSTDIFSIGTVPHPWTMTVMKHMKDDFDVSWIREEVRRDTWTFKIAEDFVMAGKSNAQRVLQFKQAVANETASYHSLWVSAERDFPTDLDFYFGFALPTESMDDGKSASPIPGHIEKQKGEGDDDEDDEEEEEGPPKKKLDRLNGPVASDEEVEVELQWLEKVKKYVALPRSTPETKLRGTLELWNMADTEVWKFTRAFQARRQLERQQWEDEEAEYSRGSGSEGGRSNWDRWNDGKET